MKLTGRGRVVVGTMLAVVSLLAACSRSVVYETRDEVMPTIVAQGWLNGSAPADDALDGKVTVLEVWAHW